MILNKSISKLTNWVTENNQLVRFVLAVLIMHFSWKVAFLTPDEHTQTLFWGINMTDTLKPVSVIIAKATYQLVALLSSSEVFLNETLIHYKEAPGLLILWGCSGVKQALIFLTVIISAKGFWQRKLWYIPLGIILLHSYNIIRLTALTIINENHIDWFDFLHGKVFKIGYYIIIFLLWVIWINKLSGYKPVTNDKS